MSEVDQASGGVSTDLPPITVRSVADGLVVTVHAELDRDTTSTLADVLRVGVEAGTAIVLDLVDDGRVLAAPSPACLRSLPQVDGAALAITDVGPGVLQFVRPASCWTVDVSAGLLCRSTAPLQPHFVPAEHWTAIGRLWILSGGITAVSACGTHLLSSR